MKIGTVAFTRTSYEYAINTNNQLNEERTNKLQEKRN